MPPGYATLPGWPAANTVLDDAGARRGHRPFGRRADGRARCVARVDRGAAGARRRARATTSSCATAWSRVGVRVAIASSAASSPTRRCSTRSAIRDAFAPERTSTAYRRPRWRTTRGRRRPGGSAGGSAASSCGSRPATCSASPTSRRSGASWPRSPRSASRRALALAEPRDAPFAVIGMGKLGGRELNYASDVDVLFVHDGDTDARRTRDRDRVLDDR